MVFKLNYIHCFLVVILLLSSQVFSAQVDPTRPFGHRGLGTVTPKGKQMVLESIIYGEGVYTVVISGNILKIDDYIGEYQLVEATQKSVILRNANERIELKIFKDNLVKNIVKTNVVK